MQTIASYRTNTSARGRLRLAADCRFTHKGVFYRTPTAAHAASFQLATLNQTLRFALRWMNKSYLFLLRLAWCHRCPPLQLLRSRAWWLQRDIGLAVCGDAWLAAFRRVPQFFTVSCASRRRGAAALCRVLILNSLWEISWHNRKSVN